MRIEGTHRRSALADCAWWRSKAQQRLLPACVTRVEEGMEVTTTSERLQSYRTRDPGAAVHRAQSHLLGLRLKRPLRVARLWPRSSTSPMFTFLIAIRRRRWMRRTIASWLTTIAAFCAPDVSAYATKSKARIPGTSWAAALIALVITDLNEPWGSSETCTGCGKCVHVCPTGALYEKGRSVAEMLKRRQFLPYLT